MAKFEKRDQVGDIYHQKNLGVNPPRGVPSHVPNYPKPSNVYCTFLQFFRAPTALVGPIFAFNTSHDVVLRNVVSFGG